MTTLFFILGFLKYYRHKKVTRLTEISSVHCNVKRNLIQIFEDVHFSLPIHLKKDLAQSLELTTHLSGHEFLQALDFRSLLDSGKCDQKVPSFPVPSLPRRQHFLPEKYI